MPDSSHPFSHTTRAEFLQRVRAALKRPTSSASEPAEPPPPPVVKEDVVRLADSEMDLIELFAARAEGVGMVVHRGRAADLGQALVDLLRELEVSRIVTSIDRLDEAGALREKLRQEGIESRPWRDDPTMAAAYEVEAGVTDVHAAIAESGTLVCRGDAAHGRAASLVPAIHVAIVRDRDILPDLIDHQRALDQGDPATLPSAVALITGPSKTADIEGVLVTGVHGPGAVHVLLVEDG